MGLFEKETNKRLSLPETGCDNRINQSSQVTQDRIHKPQNLSGNPTRGPSLTPKGLE